MGGVKGSFKMSRCAIIPHADNKTLFTIRMGNIREVCLDSNLSGGIPTNVHPRDAWITAMLTHSGARMS